MSPKNRASGWKHAKLTGHKNENLVKDLLDKSEHFQVYFLTKVGKANTYITKTSVGGLHETNVPSINARKTKSKTDLKVYLANNEVINVSIKKSPSGQVYFVRAGIFIDTFEKQFNEKVPDDVQRAIKLFWAADDDAISIIKTYGDSSNIKSYNLQLKHKSLNATTLKSYSEPLYNALINWFIDNAYKITKLSFAMGAVSDRNEWSDFIWYINLLKENDLDDIFSIEDICISAQKFAREQTSYSYYNGGTTIHLPFGFVQWHKGKLQFHHDYNKIIRILT